MKNKLFVKLAIVIVAFQVAVMSSVPDNGSEANQLLYRNALIVGSNTGAKNRTQLRYAVKDAQAFAGVLRNLGGVTATSCMVVENPSSTELISALNKLKVTTENCSNKQGRKEVVFYYSGHADERGFLLGNEVFNYSTLKALLNEIKADVRIAVVDACASGSLTREKGGVLRQPFLFDASTQMEGYAYLTSSAQHEPAMESDLIKGSYFTNTLVSGLRGGADFNSDGKVTLNEAYQFTFNETLKKTEQTITGPQHAGYDIRLKGSGDLVMTDLRAGNSGITIPKEIIGNIYIRNASGALVVEVNKQFQKTMSIGLEEGHYEVTIENGNDLYKAKVNLVENSRTELAPGLLKKTTRLASRSRGTGDESDVYVNNPVVLSFFPPLSTGGYGKTNSNCVLGILAARSGRINGTSISSLLNFVDDYSTGAIISGIGNINDGQVNGISIAGIFDFSKEGYGGQISGCSNVTGDYTGIQISGISNISNEFLGTQIDGVFNRSGKLTGIQINGVSNIASDVKGAQIGGLGNISNGGIRGAQIAGVFNLADSGQGLQIGGVGNICREKIQGTQIAGIYNYVNGDDLGVQIGGIVNISKGKECNIQLAGLSNIGSNTVRGAQIGTLNYASDIEGAQIGVVNIGRKTSKLQVGVINISGDTNGVVIGPLSIVKNKFPGLQMNIDESGFVTGILRTGNTHWCSYIGISAKKDDNDVFVAPVYGIGYRFPMSSSFIEVSYLEKEILKKNSDWDFDFVQENCLRLIAGYKVIDHFTVWGGPTLNVVYDLNDSGLKTPSWGYKSEHISFWPGLICGVEL